MPGKALSLPPKGDLLPSSLSLPPGLKFEEWESLGSFLRSTEAAVYWWIGDWIEYGEQHYGEKYAQAVETTGRTYQTLADAAWVSRRIDVSRRREDLPWSYHREVAPLEPDEQAAILQACIDRQLNRNELRALVREYRRSLAALTTGRETKAKAEAQEPAAPEQPSPCDPSDPNYDPLGNCLQEWEQAQDMVAQLQTQLDQIGGSDAGQKLVELQGRYAQLEGRLREEMSASAAAATSAKRSGDVLKQVRSALGVELNNEIIPTLKKRGIVR